VLRRWFPQIALSAVFAAGAIAWGALSLRGVNEWVFSITKGMLSEDIRELGPHDFAIVPGSMFRDNQPNLALKERLNLALDLYRAGRVKAILVSGDELRAGHEASGMRQWLLDRGVPASQVYSDPLGTRTLETMVRAARVFGVRSAIVCTQRLHAPRSLFLAHGSGIDAVALVPPSSARRWVAAEQAEPWKITLAFVEHYVLRKTAGSLPTPTQRSSVASLH
jgi:vancomycin permeability regulator SanA